jgi:hypothetical protein
MSTALISRKKILVLTSHGIRTNARWQEILENTIQEEAKIINEKGTSKENQEDRSKILDVTVLHNDYRFFSLFSFINPFRRRSETAKFTERLRNYVTSGEYDEIHLVGHSFGTHIIGHSLIRLGSDLKGKIGTVILAGSVLPGTFPWDPLFQKGIKRLVNDCGARDAVLVMNALLPLGSGLAGRRGFPGITGDHFRNRFFNFGHSGYFQKREPNGQPDDVWFMRKYWLPLLLGEQKTPYVDERPGDALDLFKGWLVDQSEHFKWLVPVGFLISVAAVYLYFALVWRTDFNLATLELAGRVVSAVEHSDMDKVGVEVANRERAIEARVGSLTTSVEQAIGRAAKESYFPDQWEQARVAAKLATKQTATLSSRQPHFVRFRGEHIAELVSLKDEGLSPEPGNLSTERIDLRTLTPSAEPMWSWTGPYVAGLAAPASDDGVSHPGVLDQYERFESMRAINLQGAVEKQYTISASIDGLANWDIAGNKIVARWSGSDLAGTKILAAYPCGLAGAATAVSENGQGLILLPGGTKIALTAPGSERIQELIGNRDCTIVSGVTDTQHLLSWTVQGQALALGEAGAEQIRSFEFSPKASNLLLINAVKADQNGYASRRAILLRLGGPGTAGEIVPDLANVEVAAFSPAGSYIAEMAPAEVSMCRYRSIELTEKTFATKQIFPTFACPFGAQEDRYSAVSLAQGMRFIEDDNRLLLTREMYGSFSDAGLEIRDTKSFNTDWLTKASRYDIVSTDATDDGSVIVTTSGDSSGDGYGADFGFYVWSPFAPEPVFLSRKDAAAERAWVSPDGSVALVRWRSGADGSTYDTEWIRLEPDAEALLGVTREKTLGAPEWGFELKSLDVADRVCRDMSEQDQWPDQPAAGDGGLGHGCVANGRFYIAARLGDMPIQLRMDEGGNYWRLRYRDPSSEGEHALAYSDGGVVPDDIQDFVSDNESRRIFLLHHSGAISRLEFVPTLSATLLRPSSPKPDAPVRQLTWNAARQWLQIETANEDVLSPSKELEFLDAEGKTQVRFDLTSDEPVVRGVSGVFDAHNQFWAIVDVEQSEQEMADRTDETQEGKTFKRYLQNLTTGERLAYSCNRNEVLGALPTVLSSRTGQFIVSGITAPTIGEAQVNTEVRVFDLEQKKCLGVFEHGDEVYDFGISNDGRLMVTRGRNEAYIWHIPTQTIVKKIAGPTRIVQDQLGVRIVSRAESAHPGVWPIPDSVARWLKDVKQ